MYSVQSRRFYPPVISMECQYDRYAATTYPYFDPEDRLRVYRNLTLIPLIASKWHIKFADGSLKTLHVTLLNGFTTKPDSVARCILPTTYIQVDDSIEIDPDRQITIYTGPAALYKINPSLFRDMQRNLHVERFEKKLDTDWQEHVKSHIIKVLEGKDHQEDVALEAIVNQGKIPLHSLIIRSLSMDHKVLMADEEGKSDQKKEEKTPTLGDTIIAISILSNSIMFGHFFAHFQVAAQG